MTFFQNLCLTLSSYSIWNRNCTINDEGQHQQLYFIYHYLSREIGHMLELFTTSEVKYL